MNVNLFCKKRWNNFAMLLFLSGFYFILKFGLHNFEQDRRYCTLSKNVAVRNYIKRIVKTTSSSKPENIGWYLVQLIADYFYKHRHETCLLTTDRCRKPYFLLLFVTSHIENFGRRSVIRKTWGNKSIASNMKIMFLVGLSEKLVVLELLESESKEYKDVLLGNFFEDFYLLTYKIQMSFEWASKYCEFKFLLKTDDDVFVDILRLLKLLKHKRFPSSFFYGGDAQRKSTVWREGKYGVQESEYKNSFYPPYCSGAGYIVSQDVVRKMTALFSTVKFFKIDDVYVGMLAQLLNQKVYRISNIYFQANNCELQPDALFQHKVCSDDCMEQLHKNASLIQLELKKSEFNIPSKTNKLQGMKSN